jgi:GNAT superfamily N-acetyltransferase
MNIRYVRLIGEKKEVLWSGRKDFSKIFRQADSSLGSSAYGPIEYLQYIKDRRGEKIAAVDPDSKDLLGWIAVFPDRDEGGLFYHLAGIEVHADHRRKGIATGLMEETRTLMEERKTHRLRFGTSPLLTQCAGLYMARFGTRYRWKQGVRLPDGRPWPYVSCECDFDDPLFKPLDLLDEEVGDRSVISWEGGAPMPKKDVIYSGPLSVLLPAFDGAQLAAAVDGIPGFLNIMHSVFDTLYVRGYVFAWFDRISLEGTTWHYYVMKKVMAL